MRKIAVAAHLQQHPGQDHRDRRGGLDVGVGQPGVYRHRRQLDHKADEQQHKGPPTERLAPQQRLVERRIGQLAHLRQGQDVEGVGRRGRLPGSSGTPIILAAACWSNVGVSWQAASPLGTPACRAVQVAGEVEHQQGDEHQHAADQGEEEELDGGVLPPRAAPDADEEVHRQQHHFPEHVEEEEVQGHEDAQHARFQAAETGCNSP